METQVKKLEKALSVLSNKNQVKQNSISKEMNIILRTMVKTSKMKFDL